ncbi:MAG: phage minor head protein [Chitinophagaceae bacterium]
MTEKQIDKLIDDIYTGAVTEYAIPESLYYMIARRLLDGLYEGYGATMASVELVDEAMLTALRTNVFQFSAAKSYQQLKTLSEKLAETGVFSEFKKEAKQIMEVYNQTWLKTEYDTAIGQAQNIVKWQEIEKTKDIMPFLRYSAIIDPNTSEICRPLDGIVAKVDDPIWNKVSPLNHFNCFEKGTKVQTQAGWINIEDVNAGDYVLGGSGESKKVQAVHVTPFVGNLVQINIKNNSVSSTENHRVLTAFGWKQAGKINAGDIIVQHDVVFGLYKIVRCINNMRTLCRYLFMSIKRKWETATINALNTDVQIGKVNINKTTIVRVISNGIDIIVGKHIKNNLFAFGKRFFSNMIAKRIVSHCFSPFIVSLILVSLIKHWVVRFHFFALGFVNSAKSWMWHIFNRFEQFNTGIYAPFAVANPLPSNRFGFVHNFKSMFQKNTAERSPINSPFTANSLHSHIANDVHGVDGFGYGAPLDGFNSIISFFVHSLWHRKFNLVCSTANVQYNGNIYNLSVEKDNSYLTNIGIVHNCRCLLIQEFDAVETVGREQIAEQVEKDMQPLFKHNPYQTKQIFDKSHPYFQVPPEDKEFARTNFGLPIPKTDSDL